MGRVYREAARAACLLACLLSSGAAGATETTPESSGGPRTITLHGDEALLVALQVLAREGEFAQALDLIAGLPPERRARADVGMVEAQLLRATGQTHRAVDLYRGLLARNPRDQRIRLELAETLFQLKDLRASEYYFRLALSGDLPDSDRKLARTYLNNVLSMRPWTITGGLGVAPDSNVNGATAAREVELWGLPFELSDEARQRSGVNITGYITGQGSVRLGDRARLVGSAWVNANENRDRTFSSEGVGARIGPEFSRPESRWSVNLTGEKRWYGGKDLYDAGGVSIDTDVARHQGLVVYAASLSAQHVDYTTLQPRDGWLYGLDVQRTRYLSPQRLWRAGANLRVNDARDETESYTLGRLSAGLYQGLPWRLGVYVEPSVSVSRYAAPDGFFAVVREDHVGALTARLVKEDYTFRGFAPYVGGEVSRSRSTITLYSYDRQRVEVGVTRTF